MRLASVTRIGGRARDLPASTGYSTAAIPPVNLISSSRNNNVISSGPCVAAPLLVHNNKTFQGDGGLPTAASLQRFVTGVDHDSCAGHALLCPRLAGGQGIFGAAVSSSPLKESLGVWDALM